MAYWDPSTFSVSDLKKIYDTNFKLIRECERRIDTFFHNDDLDSTIEHIKGVMYLVNFYNSVLNTAKDELISRSYWKP